jgi:hypothetical protein
MDYHPFQNRYLQESADCIIMISASISIIKYSLRPEMIYVFWPEKVFQSRFWHKISLVL